MLGARTAVRLTGWVVAAVATLIAIGIVSAGPLGYDTALYLAWARQLLAGGALYSPAAPYAGPNMYYPYTPLTPILFIALAPLADDLAGQLWTVGLVLVAVTVGYALLRSLASDIRPWAIAAFALFDPLIAEIILGNLNLLIVALCLLAWHQRSHPIWSGGVLAVAVGLKLMPLALPLFFIAAGAWRSAAWAAGLGGAALVGSVVLQRADWAVYLTLLPDIPHAIGTKTPIAPIGTLPEAIRLFVAVGLTLLAGRLARDRHRADLSYGLALAAVPLAAPLIVYNYLVFAVPLLAALLRGGPSWWWLTVAVTYFALNVQTPPGGAPVAFGGLVLLLVLGLAAAVAGAASGGARTLATRPRPGALGS